nr:TPM domain-containing protein [Xenorhabdus griffiniae]
MPKDGCNTRIIQPRISSISIIRLFFILFLLLIGISNVSARETKQEAITVDVPAVSKRVADISKVLTKEENQRLTRQLKKLQSEEKVQMAVLIIPTIGSDTIETFSSRVFDKWKLGNKESNDGILFLIASDDHKMRIAVGSGLERKLTDGKIARILREEVKPAFKENAYFEGISNAINSVDTLLKLSKQTGFDEEITKITPTFLEKDSSAFSKISGKDIAALLFFWLISLLLLPMKVFREGHWFKRFLKCALTIAAGTYLLTLVGLFSSIPAEFYLLILLLPVILVFLVISTISSLLKSLFGNLFGGLFGGSGSERPESGRDDSDDDSFSGGGGRSDGGGASGDW